MQKLTEEQMSDIGLDVNETEDVQKAYGVTEDWVNLVTPDILEIIEETVNGKLPKTQYLLKMVSLGMTENQRLFLLYKAMFIAPQIEEEMNKRQFMSVLDEMRKEAIKNSLSQN